ncbi:hypothetical protein L227DRAFT_568759 [Lentinus tigrinus ALCF2SS1-6]|uniref:Uncharacterized protein n=1 Tax=Lentinus tigrinus ALCF2SS1-6 TaxID=1328759 RepID=A0A5C2RKP1_9APHY|nr:hypothetical protein L227DRAFT_568759 [Lentinus tigrinus ALCF2SS1-6]
MVHAPDPTPWGLLFMGTVPGPFKGWVLLQSASGPCWLIPNFYRLHTTILITVVQAWAQTVKVPNRSVYHEQAGTAYRVLQAFQEVLEAADLKLDNIEGLLQIDQEFLDNQVDLTCVELELWVAEVICLDASQQHVTAYHWNGYVHDAQLHKGLTVAKISYFAQNLPVLGSSKFHSLRFKAIKLVWQPIFILEVMNGALQHWQTWCEPGEDELNFGDDMEEDEE